MSTKLFFELSYAICLTNNLCKKNKNKFFYEVQIEMALINVSGSKFKRQNYFVFICWEMALG